MYANVEAVLVAYLATVPGIQAVRVETPNDLTSLLPFVQVTRVGGGDNYITDSAIVDLDVIAATRDAASDAARAVHNSMMHLRHTAVNGVLIDLVETVTGPMWVNYQDENVQRYVSSYQIDSRISAQST
jgi:hypothetical protein